MKQPAVRWGLLAAAIALFTTAPSARQTSSPEELLGKALHEEQIEKNCTAAIGTYKMVADHPRASRTTASRALLQLAGCYERLGKPEARATYQRVLAYAPAGSPAHSAARAKVGPTQGAVDDPLAGRNIDAYFKDAILVTPSPQGTLVAYLKPKPGRMTLILGEQTPIAALYVRDLSSGQERRLFDPGDEPEIVGRIVWSPDGAQIAYSVQLDSTAHPVKDAWAFDLRVVSVKSGESRTIVRASAGRSWFMNWSPDSAALAFETPNAKTQARQLTLWMRGDGTIRVLGTMRKDGVPVETVAWSPDGERIAFIPDGADAAALAIASRKGGSPVALRVPPAPAGGRLRLGAWTVTGEIVVIHNRPKIGNDFYMVPADGRPFRKVCEGRGLSGGDGCQSVDAFHNFIVVRNTTSEGGRSLLRDLATGKERPLTDSPVLEQPLLLPGRNGKLIAFRSDRDGDFGIYVAPVDRLPVRNPVRIARLDSAASTAGGWWTPDGLVLNMSRNDSNIYRVDVNPSTGRPSSPPQRLTQDSPDNAGPAPSPDGKRIVYRVRGRQHGIAIMDANGANERLIASIPPDMLLTVAAQIGWRSPDEVVLHAGRTTGKPSFSILNLQTGTRQQLAQPDLQGSGLRYVATTDEVLYGRLDRGEWATGRETWARSLKTGADRLIGPGAPYTTWSEITEDLSRVFYSTADDNVGDGKPVPAELRVVNLKTGDNNVLLSFADAKGTDSVRPLAAYGNYLLYRDADKVHRIMDLESRQSWPLLTEDLKAVNPDLVDVRWAADGSYIVFSGFSQRSERRLWTGLTYDAVVKLMQQKQ